MIFMFINLFIIYDQILLYILSTEINTLVDNIIIPPRIYKAAKLVLNIMTSAKKL